MYVKGKNYVRTNGALRPLQSWAAADLSVEPYAAPFIAAFGAAGPAFLNSWIVGLANGTDAQFTTPAERAAALVGVVHGSVQSNYFMHEVDAALLKTRTNDAATRNVTSGAPHNIDEAWAIWAGQGDAASICPLAGVAKLATDAAKAPSVGPAVLAAVQAAYAATVAGDAAALERARETIVSKAVVLPETLLLLAAAQSIDAAVKAGVSPAALQATAYSYFRTIWPLIGADSDAAKAVLAAINLGGAPAANVFTAVRDVVPAWAGRFGIADADLGAFAKPAPPAPAPVKPAAKCAKAALANRTIPSKFDLGKPRQAASPGACCALCAAAKSCRGWTLSPRGVCQLKSSGAAQYQSGGYVSGRSA